MDEGQFRSTWQEVNERPCPFAKAILTRCCTCSRSRKLLIAEREAVSCVSPAAHDRCAEFLPLLRTKALFALRLTHLEAALPHGKELRVQCGGLRGLAAALGDPEAAPDIAALLDQALERYTDAQAFPWPAVVQSVTAWKPRQRKG